MIIKTMIVLGLLVNSTPSHAKKLILNIQSHRVSPSQINEIFVKTITDPINREFKGKLQINLIPQNTGKSLFSNRSLFSAVKHCKIDGMLGAPMYWRGADPNFSILGDLVPSWPNVESFNEWYTNEGESFYKKTYERFNMKFIGHSLIPSESLVSWVPLKGLDSFKNRMIRIAPGSLAKDYFTELGARVRVTPLNRVKEMINSKKFDIADFGNISSNEKENLHEKAKHTNYPGFHSMPVIDFVLCANTWKKIPLTARERIEQLTKKWQHKNYQFQHLKDKKALQILKSKDVIVHQWPKSEHIKARVIAVKIWKKYKKLYPETKQLIDSIISFLKKKNEI